MHETGPSLFVEYYIQEALTNCSESLDVSKPHIHLLLFTHDASGFHFNQNDNSVTVYDYVRSPTDVVLENIFESLLNNISSKPGRAHIMIMDDYSVFSILSTSRDFKRQSRFLNVMKKRFRKMFLFFHKDTLSSEEVGIVYEIASDICYLQPHPGAVGFNCSSSSNGSDMLKNLTTFKLTLEDEERESKNSLHLPYFEAQKTSLDNPDNFDDFEDDEEDEEPPVNKTTHSVGNDFREATQPSFPSDLRSGYKKYNLYNTINGKTIQSQGSRHSFKNYSQVHPTRNKEVDPNGRPLQTIDPSKFLKQHDSSTQKMRSASGSTDIKEEMQV
ncbi:hypothetical protein Ocin01_03795 [Orchesella cincta]|uniref:Uncharacterized protein n=1 Tax=Orchesella cincta TaxID=48709 RepID=A0A1D2NC90_ORCCI|nr:hypothetical protein Ocin01_03795 [Orchesella cincta]